MEWERIEVDPKFIASRWAEFGKRAGDDNFLVVYIAIITLLNSSVISLNSRYSWLSWPLIGLLIAAFFWNNRLYYKRLRRAAQWMRSMIQERDQVDLSDAVFSKLWCYSNLADSILDWGFILVNDDSIRFHGNVYSFEVLLQQVEKAEVVRKFEKFSPELRFSWRASPEARPLRVDVVPYFAGSLAERVELLKGWVKEIGERPASAPALRPDAKLPLPPLKDGAGHILQFRLRTSE